MIQKIKGLLARTGASINGLKRDPINSIGFLIPMTICLISIITGIISCVIFVVNGGYAMQIANIKSNGLEGISDGFTIGTVGLINTDIYGKIVLILVCSEIIVIFINYFKCRSKRMRTAMLIDLMIIGCLSILTFIVFNILAEKISFSEKLFYQVSDIIGDITINFKGILISYVIIFWISFICLLVFLLITPQCRWMIGYTALALFYSYIVNPLFILFLQNIIPLAHGVLVIAIFIMIIRFGFRAVISAPSSSNLTNRSSNKGSSYSTEVKSHREEAKKEKQPYQKIIRWDYTTTYWKDKGGYGFNVPQADCIYYKDGWGHKAYACTVYDFEKGNVAIIYKGARVMNVAGCQTPKR